MPLSTSQYGFIIDPMVPFTDASGTTIRNGYVRVFVAGSSTPVITYKNYDGATNEETIQLDNSGRTAYPVIVSKGNTYKVCVYDAEHSQESPILTIDKVVPTGANVEATNVITGLDTVVATGQATATVAGTTVTIDVPRIKDLANTAAESDIASGNYFALDGSAGTKKLNSTTLLTKTAQNALDGNVAPAFVENSTNALAGHLYSWEGKTYIAKEDYYGTWNVSKFEQVSIGNIIYLMPTTDTTFYDYAVCDKDGNAVLGVKDGQIYTKYFNSAGVPKTKQFVSLFDFVVCDDDGNAVLGLYDGHVFTKNFNSRNLDVFKSAKNYGKSVGVFGGSLSVYQESKAAKDLWRKYLKLDITDYGVGGAGFSSLQGTTPIQTQVDGAAKKDIYILWASTNDYTNSRQIGEYSDYTYLDNYDSSKLTTQCGGINYCIKKLYEKNPLAEIYFFTGIDFFSQEGGYNPFTEKTNAIGKTYQEYVDAQKKCCEFFSIPVLDQNAISGLNIFNYTNYFKNDNLHMKEVGYEKIAMQQVQFLANGL